MRKNAVTSTVCFTNYDVGVTTRNAETSTVCFTNYDVGVTTRNAVTSTNFIIIS
ncbi:hypothetical protein J6590_086904 [Homalodisca vitripennis]|nr:hypothetical protein J6590_086904 [Homalodisca vitripennis]